MPERSNPLFSEFTAQEYSPEDYKNLPRFSAIEKLTDTYPNSVLAKAVSRQLNSASRLTQEQWNTVMGHIDRNRDIDINSPEGRVVIRELVEFISSRE